MNKLVILFALSFLIYLFCDKLLRFFKYYELKKISNATKDSHLSASGDPKLRGKGIDYRVKAALFLTVGLIILSFVVPFLIVFDEKTSTLNFLDKGNIGDTLGGTMNPFIALAGVVVTGLAFYMQYRANEIQRELFDDGLEENKLQFNEQLRIQQEQFLFQQFENQFFEMLRLHKDNISEMTIVGYLFEEGTRNTEIEKNDESNSDNKPKYKDENFPKGKKIERTISGRKIFVAMSKEFKSCYHILKNELNVENIDNSEAVFKMSYFIFFLGLNEFKRGIDGFVTEYGISRAILLKLYKALKEARAEHYNKGVKKYKSVSLEFNFKPFTGHQSRLGHYYRHLFQILKFVTKEQVFEMPYEKKRDFLRILRAQLSNHEQLMLFYNWYADFGDAWEEKSHRRRREGEGNYYFTDYRMIHNLPRNLLLDKLDLDSIFTNEYRYFKFEKGRKETDSLFELVKIISLRNEQ
ncbi:MAG: putative phage abortive infection protein [Flavobacterium sp.]